MAMYKSYTHYDQPDPFRDGRGQDRDGGRGGAGGGRDDRGRDDRGDKRAHWNSRTDGSDGAPKKTKLELRMDGVKQIKTLIIHVGDQLHHVRDNMLGLIRTLDLDMEEFKAEIVDTIVETVSRQPEKVTVYSTLIGLLSVKNYEVSEEIMEKIFQKLDTALHSGQFLLARTLVRFFCDAQNACLIFPSSVVSLLESLLSVVEEEDDEPRRGRHDEGEGDGAAYLASQWRRDVFADMVVSALPWVGRDLAERKPADLDRIMTKLDTYMSKRKTPHVGLLASFGSEYPLRQEDEVSLAYAQVKTLQARGWQEAVIFRLYDRFSDTLREALQMSLPPLHVPPKPFPGEEDPIVYPTPRVAFRLFDMTDTPNPPLMPPSDSIERGIVERTIREMLFAYSRSHRDCARQICEYVAPLDGLPCEYVIVEVILGEMLRLPETETSYFYYYMLMAELIRLHSDIPTILTLALHNIWQRLPFMEVECLSRYVEWTAHFLNYFEFKFRWETWFPVAEMPDDALQVIYVKEVLSRAMRLSYHARVERVVPEELAKVKPQEPTPNYKFAALTADEERQLDIPTLAHLLKTKETTVENIMAWLDGVRLPQASLAGLSDDKAAQVLRQHKRSLFVQTCLHVGIKSISHILYFIEKFLPVWKSFAQSAEGCAEVVGHVVSFWHLNPQMMVIILDKLVIYDVIDPPTIYDFMFGEDNVAKVQESHIWEIAFNALDVVCDKVDTVAVKLSEARAQLQEKESEGYSGYHIEEVQEDVRKLSASFAEATKNRRLAFVSLYENFIRVLDVQVRALDAEGGDAVEDKRKKRYFDVTVGRLAQLGRKYHKQIKACDILSWVDNSLSAFDKRVSVPALAFKCLLAGN